MNKLLREDKTQKPDFTYLGMLYGPMTRVVERFMMGERKYSKGNWRAATDPKTFQDSLIRHTMQYINGQEDEDHLSAIVANALMIMDLEDDLHVL